MKKASYVLALILIFTMAFTTASYAAEEEIQVTVEGKTVEFPDGKPYKDSAGRVQVPVRFLAEALGVEVSWNAESQTVGFSKGDGLSVSMSVGQDWYETMGKSIQMDTAATMKDGRVYAPVRFISEAFGTGVKWDEGTSTVILGGKAEPGPFMLRLPGGFIVPENTALSYKDLHGVGGVLVTFTVDFDSDTSAQQVGDLKQALLQVYNEKTTDMLMKSFVPNFKEVLQGDGRVDYLKAADQYLETTTFGDRPALLQLSIYKPGITPPFMNKGEGTNPVNVVQATATEPLRLGLVYDEQSVNKELAAYAKRVFEMNADYLVGDEKGTKDFAQFVDLNVAEKSIESGFEGREEVKRHFELRPMGQLDALSLEDLKTIADSLRNIDVPKGTLSLASNGKLIADYRYTITLDGHDYDMKVQFQFTVYDDQYFALSAVYVS